ncbi:MAG TPA: hypothetical protein VG839_03460 [Asticcacaulis sp.]|nr:hypothetical protein [Asticcacaulis sp.]
MTTSAYMIAHCDDDFLQDAIDSVIDRVDELVFVDGAYRWTAPFFAAAGLDPERSWQRTHDILARYGDKIRYFSGIWDDELHKRSFAWSHCRGEVIIRIDADEIFVFNDKVYAAFLKSDRAVAQVEMPFMLTPTQQRLKAGMTYTPRLCAIYKSAYFSSPLTHCAYLWLILTEQERNRMGEVTPSLLYGPPVARAAHLTGMRTPRTSVNRARFYTLQYVRVTGDLNWSYCQKPVERPEERIAQIFDFMSSTEYTSYLEGHDIVSGFATMQDFRVAPFRFEGRALEQIEAAYDSYNQGLAELLDFGSHPRTVVSDVITMINLTSLVRRGLRGFEIEFAHEVEMANAHFYLLLDSAEEQGGVNLEPVHARVAGRTVHYVHERLDDTDILQAVLIMRPMIADDVLKTQIVRLTPGPLDN